MTSVAAIAMSFGMNDSVISLICVAAWKAPMTRPGDERDEQQRRGEHQRHLERVLAQGHDGFGRHE